MTEIIPRHVISTMRRIKRNQSVSPWMNEQCVEYIFDHKLMRKYRWPAWVIQITDTGLEYIREHGGNNND